MFVRLLQDLNLRGQSPMDFESIALTARPNSQDSYLRAAGSWYLKAAAKCLAASVCAKGKTRTECRARPRLGQKGKIRTEYRARTCDRGVISTTLCRLS